MGSSAAGPQCVKAIWFPGQGLCKDTVIQFLGLVQQSHKSSQRGLFLFAFEDILELPSNNLFVLCTQVLRFRVATELARSALGLTPEYVGSGEAWPPRKNNANNDDVISKPDRQWP